MKLNQLTIKQVLDGLQKKKFSATELTKACLKRIKEVEPKINAFITICEKEALEEAKKIDIKLQSSKVAKKLFEQFPLLGIPFSMKDVYCTKGVRTTAASSVLKNYVPQYSATVYKRLCEAGAILIGKTNCDAWGHGSSTENSDFGVTKNPWDEKRVAGGSSGGSAATLATEMSLFDIGEDTGGSIRLPASFCSIVGLKVTYGRVSRYGSIAYASSLDTVGPMTKTVEDCALVLNVMAGKDPLDATTFSQNVPDYWQGFKKFKGLKSLRVGLPREFFGKGIDEEIKENVLKAIGKLRQLGVKTQEVSLPTLRYAIPIYYLLALSETSSNLARYDGVRHGNDRGSFGDEAKRRILLGTFALSAGYYDQYYLKAQKARTILIKEHEEVFKKVDVLLAPVSPTPPFKIGEKADDSLAMFLADIYTVSVNCVGVPSLALPCGFTESNLPIGMQIIGPQFSEELLFQIGHAYEQATAWHKKKPEI